jgi:hypothetical protein
MVAWSYIGVVFVLFIGYKFFMALGKKIPILEFLLLIAGMQWVLGAFIEYRNTFGHFKYYMYVSENVYMQYVVPAYIVFSLVLLRFASKRPVVEIIPKNSEKYSFYGILLLGLGIICDLLLPSVPSGLAFIFFLLSGFKYVGALILFFSKKKRHRQMFYTAIFYLLIYSIIKSFFHALILWSAFFYMFWTYKYKPSIRFNIMIIIVGFVASTVIQLVKSDYRDMIWNGYSGNQIALFFDIISSRISGGISETPQEEGELNARLNQGWIISAIMEHTPRVQSYANGETVNEAVYASLLPRFLSPNKKTAGGVDNFEKYTGIELEENTSMGMSLIGEGYANYGVSGGIIFMGILGFGFSLILDFYI